MKLRLPLALLVAWALACGGGEEEVTTTPPPPEPPTEVTPPVPPPPPTTPDGTATTPPPTTPDGTTPPTTPDGTATTPPTTPDGTAATDGTVEEGPVETKEEGTTKVETRSLKTSASVPVGKRNTLDEVARRQLQKRATDLGYSKITNFQLGDARCDERNCTASATATASRTVTVPAENK